MTKEYKLEDIKREGFIHSRVYEYIYDPATKVFKVNFGFADLKTGGALVDCTITISEWWEFEVLHYRGKKVLETLKFDDVPEVDGIVDYSYDGNTLILEDLCGIDEYYHFKFTKPKIQIRGEYDPD